uniref:Uncharacterized protein n=1 Tax=Candidatus Kentrum sp. LPFa TaxID=2126335 RepID=A0A450X112_9GAMM|nr:MAG: hypothetical protein BECKLPF1236A_GA0070988_103621 [Candidatus Kentron sp. LPFa]VFK35391.1 MAG: hypothetical protein BECKLPF1236C_GA0070990_103681 [Candidatus Kentron sp. LPFa]
MPILKNSDSVGNRHGLGLIVGDIGVCQDSCPVTFTMINKLYSLARISLGGLSHTSFTGFQFLVLPDQRSGFFALVAS